MPGILPTAPAGGAAISGGVLDLIWNAGPVVKLVLLLLLGFSFVSWGIIFYKYRVIKKAFAESRTFLEIFWEGRSLDLIYEDVKGLTTSPLSNIFRAGYIELVKMKRIAGAGRGPTLGAPAPGPLSSSYIDDIVKKIRWTSAAEVNHLEKYVSFLATTGSTAPFIGLFGTVWGIMDAFRHIGIKGAASISVVAPGISEALVATAIGLFAAIPAVVGYNYFVNKIRIIVKEVEGFTDDYVSDLHKYFEKDEA
ncbi:MAG TPA: protein TolQ [Planctomycetota bacterium]|nr:protein TolQ [Planctomycetota bacterium]